MDEEKEEEIIEYPWEQTYEYTWDADDKDEKEAAAIGTREYYEMLRNDRKHRVDYPVKRNIFRNVVIILDLSYSMADADIKPSRLEVAVAQLKNFIKSFFNHNSLSLLSLVASHDKKAFQLTPLSRHVSEHLRALDDLSCSGGFSLQSSLQMAMNAMWSFSSHYSKEIICMISSLNTNDPGNIFDTMKDIEKQNISCSVMSYSGEVYVFQQLVNITKGTYYVPQNPLQVQYFLNKFIEPPIADEQPKSTVPVRKRREIREIGFPKQCKENLSRICACHLRFCNHYYQCPKCLCYVCELPMRCPVCELMLVDYTHLTRSYHYLFPPKNFREVSGMNNDRDRVCYGCYEVIPKHETCMECSECRNSFCLACDAFVHDGLFHCPGCLYTSLSVCYSSYKFKSFFQELD